MLHTSGTLTHEWQGSSGKRMASMRKRFLFISTSWDEKWHWNLGNDEKCFEPIFFSSRSLSQWAHKNANSLVKNKVIPGLQFQTN